MLTIFTTPKPFKGHSKIIQLNAIKSWTMLRPRPEIILFGDDEGTAEVVEELGLTHIVDVERTNRGTPLISSMFHLAQERSSSDLFCYLNADIMLTSQFIEGLNAVAAAKPQFVLTGRRTLVDIDTPWQFANGWEDSLRKFATEKGKLDDWVAMDYFAFPRGVYTNVPPFVVGRARWDNWVIYSARRRGITVVDASNDVLAVHQNHDYSHLAGGVKDCFTSAEGQNNQELYGLQMCIGTIDATHMLKRGQLRRALEREHISRTLDTWSLFHPALGPLAWPFLAARDSAKAILRMAGLKTSNSVPSGSWAQPKSGG